MNPSFVKQPIQQSLISSVIAARHVLKFLVANFEVTHINPEIDGLLSVTQNSQMHVPLHTPPVTLRHNNSQIS